MAIENDEYLFNQAFTARTQQLRKERGWTAAQMATALGIPVDRYRKYETRSPLPSYLIERFCIIVGCDIEFLITGSPKRPALFATDSRKQA